MSARPATRRTIIMASALPVAVLFGFFGYVAWLGIDGDQRSQCYGTASGGSLAGGRRLPYAGQNYRAYSILGFLLGRTFVHSAVRDAMRDAYAQLGRSHPELQFVYAESGWPWGGSFRPHKTHANGTAADFLVPVRTLDGQVSTVSTSPFNLFGYANEFDSAGRSGAYRLDFEAMALHLLGLDQAARSHGIRIRRVIFDVGLQPKLAAAGPGLQVLRRLSFNKQQAWVRHDDHYHVDFEMACR
jgi:penicillin-insensitive murein endopeptidase